ncbi:Alpha-tubulin N-acetyltransferase 1 [Lamellibrachia satsuma]|nr:Alpha-tubulin N-acetyltransferase 1 [Lamellibrachia satsuma]
MEFPFNINTTFPNEITLLDSRLTIGENGSNNLRHNKDQLTSVINQMGIASSKAQGLNGVITSVSRLTVSTHHLYFLKDADANNGQGAAVGILRVGHKKLFVYDREGANHELEPLCVLDFYVHESRQRTGCGKRLFECMLATEQRRPVDFAVDRPSPKFLAFLAKHYNLKALIPQVNNFVIFDGFFANNAKRDQSRRSFHQPNRLPSYANPFSSKGRQNDTQDSQCNIHGRDHQEISFVNEKEALSHITASNMRSGNTLHDSPAGRWSMSPSLMQELPSAMGAQHSHYSRHMSPISPVPNKPSEVTEIVVDATKVYSPPLIRRRNGPSDDYSQLTNSRKDLSSAVEDMKKSNFSQDTAPETITATMTNSDALQSSERKPPAVPGLWAQRNADPSWKKSTYDVAPAIGRYTSSRKYTNHTRLW